MQQKREPQEFDSTLKSLFGKEAAEIVPQLLPGSRYLGEHNIEIDRTTIKADLVYRVIYDGKPGILNMELQTGSDSKMAVRLLKYFVGFYDKYELPVISMVIYPFKTNIPKSPFEIKSGKIVRLTFHHEVLTLWTMDARTFVRKHVVALYTLLPGMKHASVALLKQALAEMRQRYPVQADFGHHLVRFGKILRRSTTMTEQEKREVEEVMRMQYSYDWFIDDNEEVAKRVAIGEERGKLEGKLEGLQEAAINVVKIRFPALAMLAQQHIGQFNKPDELNVLMQQLLVAPDEATVVKLLHLPTA